MKVPVEFRFKEKDYKGTLESVQGAGTNQVFHLYINDFFYGRLRKANGWQFDSNRLSEGMEVLADYFGGLVD